MDLNTAREWWNAGKFSGPYYLCLVEHHQDNVVLLLVDGLEDPKSEPVTVWQGPPIMRQNDFVPMKPMILYRDGKYYLGIYDVESAQDIYDQTNREDVLLEIVGEMENLTDRF